MKGNKMPQQCFLFHSPS